MAKLRSTFLTTSLLISPLDLKEQYDVRLEQGLDAFVVVDGLPVVPEDSKPKLVKFLVKQLNKAGKVKEDGFFMPTNNKGMTEGYDLPPLRGRNMSLSV